MNIALAEKRIAGVDEPRTEAEEAAESYFATALKPLDPGLYSMDPAERLEFSRAPSEGITRFDRRSDHELKAVMFDHENSVERERAAWEYGDRHQAEAVSVIAEIAKDDRDRAVRWGALWLLQKIGGNRTLDSLAPFLSDDDIEVRDWAHLLSREVSGVEQPNREIRSATFDTGNPFDQTLPLTIAGYARTHFPGMGWVQVTLSPQWFEAILGRVMACTCEKTFGRDLVIEKRLKNYHPDGTDHYEIFKFSGATFYPYPGVTHHVYECVSNHTFYPSGQVEDTSIRPIGDVNVILNRVANPAVVPVRMPIIPISPLPILTRSSKSSLSTEVPSRYVDSVRGRYMGSAFVNIERLLNQEMKIGPGEVQLASWHHPTVGKMTNTFLFGTFKGKISDLDDDGYLNINTEYCHGTLDGKLDYTLSGEPIADPFDTMATT